MSDAQVQIKNLEDLLDADNKNKEIIQQKISRLTAPGENYGSLMYAINITLKTLNGTEEEISAVAKTVPPNEHIQKIFRTQITFKIEIYFYKTIVPLLHEFQKQHGVTEVVDFSPKFFGGRVSLDKNSDTVDDDGVLLLENLKLENYTNLDRFRGFDLDAAKLVIKDLAYLHAIPLAIKIKTPEVFEKKIKTFLLANNQNTIDKEQQQMFMDKTYKAIASVKTCEPYLDKIKQNFEKALLQPSRELFSTISHNDCWVNNTMIKVENGKAVKNKLVDFQMVDYASSARDLIFFLFSSVRNEILERSYDDLISFYYSTFISALNELKCDVKRFSFEAFLDEINFEAKSSQFAHCAAMVLPIFQPKGTVKDIDELSLEEMFTGEITDLQKEKISFVVQQFLKRNWI